MAADARRVEAALDSWAQSIAPTVKALGSRLAQPGRLAEETSAWVKYESGCAKCAAAKREPVRSGPLTHGPPLTLPVEQTLAARRGRPCARRVRFAQPA